jgi:hypothetical protein
VTISNSRLKFNKLGLNWLELEAKYAKDEVIATTAPWVDRVSAALPFQKTQ